MTSRDLAGGCVCGAVRFVAWGRSDRSYVCHCTECQRRCGSAFAMLLPVGESRFRHTGDTLCVEQVEAEGVVAELHACAKCLTRIFTRNPKWPGLVVLRVGTLDDAVSARPAFHIWTRSRQLWIALPTDVPTFAEQPADPAEWRRLLS